MAITGTPAACSAASARGGRRVEPAVGGERVVDVGHHAQHAGELGGVQRPRLTAVKAPGRRTADHGCHRTVIPAPPWPRILPQAPPPPGRCRPGAHAAWHAVTSLPRSAPSRWRTTSWRAPPNARRPWRRWHWATCSPATRAATARPATGCASCRRWWAGHRPTRPRRCAGCCSSVRRPRRPPTASTPTWSWCPAGAKAATRTRT